MGIIGCGSIALKHATSLKRLGDTPLVALADMLPERMESVIEHYRGTNHGIPKTYTDYRQLLRRSDVDTVLISVPTGLHASTVQAALTHGKHVILEKPMALSTRDAMSICKLADKTGRRLVVCHQKRFYPHLRRIRDVIRHGAIGRIVSADVTLMLNRSEDYYNAAGWRGTWAMDGGMLLNQGIHDIDLLIWMLGKPTQVVGRVSRQLRKIETEDTAAAIFAYADGAIATISATVCARPSSVLEQLTIVGTDGAVVLAGKGLEHIVRWDVDGLSPPSPALDDPYEALYLDLHTAIARNTTPLVTGWEAFHTLQAILGIYQSHLANEAVRLPLGDFSTSEMEGVFEPHV